MKIYNLDRTKPLRLFDDFSVLKDIEPVESSISFCLSRNEYFIIQLLLVSDEYEETVSVECGKDEKYGKLITCFNTEGRDKYGKFYKKSISISKKEIQPIYIGVNLFEIIENEYSCDIKIIGKTDKIITLEFNLTDEKSEHSGYDNLENLSRLNWLNSDAFLNDNAVPPYKPVEIKDNSRLSIIGRVISFADNGLPGQMSSYFDESICLSDEIQAELLSKAFEFTVGDEIIKYERPDIKNSGDNADIILNGESENIKILTKAVFKYEGFMDCKIEITAKNDIEFEDISLKSVLSEKASVYNNGLGKKGGFFEDIHYKWCRFHQDSVYIFGVNCGVRIKLKAENYVKPLVNIYYDTQPMVIPEKTWDNSGNGRIHVERQVDGTAAFSASTGKFVMKKDETRIFCFELHFTPFRPIDYKKHYRVRYQHNGALRDWESEIKTAKKCGLNYINVHHANDLNPYINYPFIEQDEMKKFVKAAHENGIGAKFYYTIREQSNHMREIFAYKSFGNEIIIRKAGKGHSWVEGSNKWLPKYLGNEYTPAWRVDDYKGKYKGKADEAFIVYPGTRLENYYIEGLDWLVKNIGIDGIYIDDTALDRTTLERARKVLMQNNGLIDFHMWNHMEDRGGNISCMILYTELFPFVDSIWVGEGYPYNDLSSDYMLAEVSGIPYGLTSEMLEDGGNPWFGMLYAMNCRHNWVKGNALPVYKLWDSFGIEEAKMRGYWDSGTPVKTDKRSVKVTSYLKDGKALVCAYNESEKQQKITYLIDDTLLGFKHKNATAECFEMKGLQKYEKINLSDEFTIKPKKGMMFILSAI